jgi:transcriptional regulator with XRE-family HTH domain
VALSTTPSVIRRYLAFELKRLREAAGKHQSEAAKRIDTSGGRIGHFETGRNLPKLPEIEILLPFYGAAEMVDGFRELIVQARTGPAVFEPDELMTLPPGFDLYLGLEQGATRIFTYSPMTVMGLLQCRPYADALVRGDSKSLDEADVQRWLDLRMRRQDVLDKDDSPLELVSIIDEAVLHREIGGSDVLGQQLDHLLEMAKRPNVTIRVLPYKAGVHPALHGPFIILDFPIERDPGVVYLEDWIGGRYRDDVEEIDEYAALANRLVEPTLSEANSVSVIRKVRKELR